MEKMKRTIVVILFMPMWNLCFAQPESSQRIIENFSKLEWICHTWERTNVRPGQKAWESWSRISNQAYIGYGVTLQGADTVFREELKIVIKDDRIYYVAEVSHNQSPTYFELSITGDQAFSSSNPDHDFPKKIDYSLQGDQLTATISGDGKKIDFNFVKSRK